jgi:hypothetical protein
MAFGSEGRRAIVLLLLCLVLAAQTAGFASANDEHRNQGHCCLLCHVGPLPFLHTNVSALVAPAFRVIWLEPPQDLVATPEILCPIRSSRAPPA